MFYNNSNPAWCKIPTGALVSERQVSDWWTLYTDTKMTYLAFCHKYCLFLFITYEQVLFNLFVCLVIWRGQGTTSELCQRYLYTNLHLYPSTTHIPWPSGMVLVHRINWKRERPKHHKAPVWRTVFLIICDCVVDIHF